MEGKQPLLTPEDCLLAEEIVKADPEIAAMLRDDYGITDLSLVACDPWSGTPSQPFSCALSACTEQAALRNSREMEAAYARMQRLVDLVLP